MTNEEYRTELKSLNKKIEYAKNMGKKSSEGDPFKHHHYVLLHSELYAKRKSLAGDFRYQLQASANEIFDEILQSREKKYVLGNILVKQENGGACFYSHAFNLTNYMGEYQNKWQTIYTICKSPDDYNIYRGECIITHGKILINVNDMFVDCDPDEGLIITDCLTEIMLIFTFFYRDSKDVYAAAMETKDFFESKISAHKSLIGTILKDEVRFAELVLLNKILV